MNKYKIGDRVRVINGIGKLQYAMRGRVGTVAASHEIDGVQHCWVLIDGFDNPHNVDPTIAFHYNQLAPWRNDSKDAKELAMSRYIKYKNDMKQVRYQTHSSTVKLMENLKYLSTKQSVFTDVVSSVPEIKSVIYSGPATIVFWKDGTKTVVKCNNEKNDPEKGLAMAFSKKMFGNKGNYYNVFKKWLPEEKPRNATIPICHEIRDEFATYASKIKKIKKLMCCVCAYNMKFENGAKCICSQSCIDGDKWRPKK